MFNPEYDEEEHTDLDEKEFEILQLLHKKKEVTLQDVMQALGQKNILKYIKSLYTRGIILMREEVTENYRPKLDTYVLLTADWKQDAYARETLAYLEKRAPKQADLAMVLLGHAHEMEQKLLSGKFNISASAIAAAEKKGWLYKEKRQVSRILKISDSEKNFTLSGHQASASAEIEGFFKEKKPVLLHGITGSGKTFLYIEQIKKALAAGKQVLYLLPEVGITEQLVQRLSVFFGPSIGVWHHMYSSHEKTELYYKVMNKELQLIIGARSAIFAPFRDLGLVIVDEEHENTMKQFDRRPHYNGRDAAMHLAKMTDARVILGSATPSYEMLHAARSGSIGLVELLHRFESLPQPAVVPVHMGQAKLENRVKSAFSIVLLEEIQKRLDAGEQVIVFQNRKGYVPYTSCDFCGFTAQCNNCDISLTYYKNQNLNKCGYCGYSAEPLNKCPACGSNSLSMKGYGTERIAEELGIYFPEARITRFDHDSIRKRSDFQNILNGFANKEIDILVGTQLLSKGLDFENVGLVGVIDADMLINIPDFRSHERAFQQLYQVGGRAGRHNKQGMVIVQGCQVQHPVIRALFEDDYKGFAAAELQMRAALNYPPYSRLIKVVLSHKDFRVNNKAAEEYVRMIRKGLKDRVLGPQAPVVGRVRNYFIQHILIKALKKSDDIVRIKQYLLEQESRLKEIPEFKGLRLDFDVDPY